MNPDLFNALRNYHIAGQVTTPQYNQNMQNMVPKSTQQIDPYQMTNQSLQQSMMTGGQPYNAIHPQLQQNRSNNGMGNPFGGGSFGWLKYLIPALGGGGPSGMGDFTDPDANGIENNITGGGGRPPYVNHA